MAISVGSRELKNRLGKYLRMVREGMTILITDRGRPVAELRPLRPSTTDLEERLDELAAQGLITRSSQSLGPLPAHLPLRIEGASLSDVIVEEREDRF